MSVCKIPKECVSVVHTRLTNYLLPTLHAPWFYTPIGEVIEHSIENMFHVKIYQVASRYIKRSG